VITLSWGRTSILIGAAALSCLPVWVNAAAKPKSWNINVDTGGYFDTNLSKALWQRDTVEDEAGYLNANFTYEWEPSRYSLLSASLIAQTEQFDTVTALNSTSFGGEVALGWQSDFGFLAPFYRFSLKALRKESENSARSSDIYNFQAFVTRRVTTKITGRLGYNYKLQDAEHEVFDVEEHRAFANFDYLWSDRFVTYFTAGYSEGDIYSVAQGTFCNGLAADDIYPFIKYSEVIWRDSGFNQHFCGDWFAYRMNAETTTFTLGANFAYDHRISFDISVLDVDSEVSDWIRYERQILRAGMLMRF